jgi:hypothetical protein
VEIHPTPSEDLPALYRAILDGIADLERVGQHREAALIRTRATKIYSTSWDASAHRRLTHIHRRIGRVLAGEEKPQHEQTGSWRTLQRALTTR